MKRKKLEALFEEYKTDVLEWEGSCHDCEKDVTVIAHKGDEIEVSGGAIYDIPVSGENKIFLKCDECFHEDRVLRNYQPCEVYSRVVGYLRPVQQWNGAKREEHKLRKFFNNLEKTAS